MRSWKSTANALINILMQRTRKCSVFLKVKIMKQPVVTLWLIQVGLLEVLILMLVALAWDLSKNKHQLTAKMVHFTMLSICSSLFWATWVLGPCFCQMFSVSIVSQVLRTFSCSYRQWKSMVVVMLMTSTMWGTSYVKLKVTLMQPFNPLELLSNSMR